MSAEDFIPASLAALGIDVDEVDLAVMGALHQLIWPALCEMLTVDTEGLELDRCPDLSRAPQ